MEMVYHYTTMDSLLKIIEGIKVRSRNKYFVFRATNIFFLNDPQEFIYGQQVLMETLREIEYDKPVYDNLCLSTFFSRFPQKSEDEWLVEFSNAIQNQNASPYVISFSRNNDSLPMWLNYGEGGRGVCLAFTEYRSKVLSKSSNPKSINEAVVNIYDSLGTYDVHYGKKDVDEKDNILKKNLDYMYDYYLKKVKTISKEDLFELQKGMLWGLSIVHAPYIKSKDYEGEREVRLSKTIYGNKKKYPNKINFRCNSKGHIVPYIEIEIPVKQLSFVRIGPLANKDLAIKAIEMMKKKYNLEFNIKCSDIKYRDY